MLTLLFGITIDDLDLLLWRCADFIEWVMAYYADLLCQYKETIVFVAMCLGCMAPLLFATFILVILNERRMSVK